jgi:hypothetical protein
VLTQGRDSESGGSTFPPAPLVQIKMVGVRLILIGSGSMQICVRRPAGRLAYRQDGA